MSLAGTLKNYEQFVIEDLQTHKQHTGWDAEADIRFALAFGHDEAAHDIDTILIHEDLFLIRSMYKAKQHLRRVKQRRICALQRLMKQGKVTAEWVGTKEDGFHYFGLRRERVYRLK